MSKKPPEPAILLREDELALRIVLKSIIAAFPSDERRDSKRLKDAFKALTGKSLSGERIDRDEMLEIMAFDYSVASISSDLPIPPTSVASSIVRSHPETRTSADEAKLSIWRDIERKFSAYKEPFLARHAFNSNWDEPAFYRLVREIISALERANIPTDRSVLPPGYR